MTDLMYALYDYARSKEMPKYLLTDEYRQVQRAISVQRRALEERYPDLYDALDSLLSEINLENALELEAMFQAALALEVKLPR